jgi:hypothetical protein
MSPEEWLAKQPAGKKAPLALSPEEWLAQQNEEPKGESGFIPSIKRGARGVASLATDILPAMVGKATGNEEYAQKQLKEAAAYQKETARLYPAEIESYKDIKGVGDALTYVKEAIGEAIPSLIPSLVTGGAAGIAARGATAAAMQAAERVAAQEIARASAQRVLTKEALDGIRDTAISAGAREAQKIALKYQAVGAVAGSAAQNIPDVYQNIYEATGQEDLGAAIAFGGFNAALDAILPVNLLRKFTKTGISPEEVAAAWYKRAGKGAAKGFVTEGGTEALQEVSSAAAEKFVDENQEFFSEKNFERFINSGLKGGFGGAGITAATDVAFGKGPVARPRATGQTTSDTLAGDEDVAGINEPAGGESTGVAGEPGAERPPGGLGGAKSDRVVPTEQAAGRLDDREEQSAAALTAFDDFNRQYNDLRQEANEIYTSPTRTPGDVNRLRMINRDLASVIDANTNLIGDAELARRMKNSSFDASRELSAIRFSMDVGSASQPRAMQSTLFGADPVAVSDMLRISLDKTRQDPAAAIKILETDLANRAAEQAKGLHDSTWATKVSKRFGLRLGDVNTPEKIKALSELFMDNEVRNTKAAIAKLQDRVSQPRAMQSRMFDDKSSQESQVGTDKPESLTDVFRTTNDVERSELSLENQAKFDAYRERQARSAEIESRQSKDKSVAGASITPEEFVNIATAKKQELEKQLAESQQEVARLQELFTYVRAQGPNYPLTLVTRRTARGPERVDLVKAIDEETKILKRIETDIAGVNQQISDAQSRLGTPQIQPVQRTTPVAQDLPGMETGERRRRKALPVSTETETALNEEKLAERLQLLQNRRAERDAKREEFGAAFEDETAADEAELSVEPFTDKKVEPVTDEAVEASEKEELANLQAERIAKTVEGRQIVDFFDAIKSSSTKESEQEKHGQPKRSALRKLLSFDIVKPGETTTPAVQAALRFLANRMGGVESFEELLSKLKTTPAELQPGVFKRDGLPDLTTRRGMEDLSSQIDDYISSLTGKGTGIRMSTKSMAASVTGEFRGVMPYTEEIKQFADEALEYAPFQQTGEPRQPDQRQTETVYALSDTKIRSARRILLELIREKVKLSRGAKAAAAYIFNPNRDSFGEALRDVAFDVAMFEVNPKAYPANGVYSGEGGAYAKDFQAWIVQNLDVGTAGILDDMIKVYKNNVASSTKAKQFEKAYTAANKQAEERRQKAEKFYGRNIPAAPKKSREKLGETETTEQSGYEEPKIPAKNLPREQVLYDVYPSIADAIKAGDTRRALELMAQSKTDKYYALLAQRLLDANITAKIEMIGTDEMSPLSPEPGISDTLDGYLTALRDVVITTLPKGKQAKLVRQLESKKLRDVIDAFEELSSSSGNFTDGQHQLLADTTKFFNEQYFWDGKYNPATDKISVRIGRLTNHMFMHEALHAATDHLISRPDELTGVRRQGYDRLVELFEYSKGTLALKGLTDSTIYGLKNLHEFVSEAMTNPEFQATLRAIRYKASPYSLMSRFADGIRKLFNIVDPTESNVLNEVIFSTDIMMMGGSAGRESLTSTPRAMAGKRKPILPQGKRALPVGRPDSKTAISNMMSSRSWGEVKSQWPVFYSNLAAKLRPIALGGLTLRQLGDLVDNRIPQVDNFIRVSDEYLSRKNQMLNESGDITKRWTRLQVANPDMSRKLGAVMFRATLAELDPDRATIQQGKENVELMTQWNQLDDKAKGIYREVRNYYEKRFSEYKRTLNNRVELMKKYGVSEATISKIRKEFEQDIRKGPYFPLMRYGRFWYQVGKGNNREYYMFETLGEKQAHLTERLERNPELNNDDFLDGSQYQTQMDSHARESTFLKAAFDAIDSTDNMGDKQSLKDELYQTWLANLPETSFRNRFIHRKAVEGFSQDALRNFSSSSFHMAYQMSRFEHSPELFSQITAARSQLKERRDDEDRANLEVMRENNELSDYVQELNGRMEKILNPEDVGPVVSLLSNVGFIYYLTSVASAATNVLGGMIIGLPTLISHQIRMNPNMSYTAATMASLGQMKNAAMQIMATGFSVDRGPRLRDSYVLFPSLDRSSSLSKIERDAYNKFVADGVIDITAAYDQSGLASAPTANYGGTGHRAMQAVAALFHNAERFNREVVAMSAFRAGMAKRAGEKDQKQAFIDSIADAKNVTTQSMFDYSSVNKPRYMQSPAARVILQFKQFPQQMTFYLVRNLQHSLVGATPEVKREARARFVGTMGMTAIFAGSTGLWGFSTVAAIVNAVINGLGDDDEEPFDFELEYMNWASETFGKNLGMFLTRGAGNAAGADLHSRVSLDDMWFRDGRKNTDEAEALQEFLVSMLGPTVGIAVNAARAVDLFNQGHADRAIETVSPGFIKQPLVAARYAREGANTLKGDPLVQDVGPMDLLMQSLGFRPTEIAELQYYNITKKGQEQAILKERQNLLNLFGISFMANDADANEKAFEKIMKFNAKYPSKNIPMKSLTKSIKERATKSAMARHGLHIDKKLQGLINETYIDRLTEDEE